MHFLTFKEYKNFKVGNLVGILDGVNLIKYECLYLLSQLTLRSFGSESQSLVS